MTLMAKLRKPKWHSLGETEVTYQMPQERVWTLGDGPVAPEKAVSCGTGKTPIVRLALSKTKCATFRGEHVSNAADSIALVHKHFAKDQAQEFACVIGLNPRNEVLTLHEVSMGALDAALVDPRVLFAGLLLAGASGFILFHNHPSAESKPSHQDDQLTNQIFMGAKALGMRFLDHIILTPNDPKKFYSYLAAGRMRLH